MKLEEIVLAGIARDGEGKKRAIDTFLRDV